MKPHGYRWMDFSIPERMGDGISRYVESHIEPGGFLTAVIQNDLREACGRADDENLLNLPAFVAWFWNHAPSACWGSPERMASWLALRKREEVRNEQ